MTTQPAALHYAKVLEDFYLGIGRMDATGAAAELRRLHEAHDWQYKMAGERLRRIEKLEALNQELLEALKYWAVRDPHNKQTCAAIARAEGTYKATGEIK